MGVLKALLYAALVYVAAVSCTHAPPHKLDKMMMPWSYSEDIGSFQVWYEVTGQAGLPVAFVIVSDQGFRYGAPTAPESIFVGELQERYHAKVFQYESRGYNEFSRLHPGSLHLLTVENAVRDIETFITNVVLPYSPGARIVVIGTGYGGQLAAYYNVMFSRARAVVVDTARVDTPLTFPLYAQLETALSPGCRSAWGDVVANFDGLIAEGGADYVGGDFLMCKYTDLEDADWTAFMWHSVFFPVANALGFTYNKTPVPHATRDNICRSLERPTRTQWKEFRDIVLKDLRPEARMCLATDYESFGDEHFNGYLNSMTAQQCMGMGQFPVNKAGPGSLPVDIPVAALHKACAALLGDSWEPSIAVEGAKKLKKLYGGRNYVGNNTFAANALNDVYYPLTPVSAGDNSVVVDYDGYRGSLFAERASTDSPALVKTRAKMIKFLDSILF